MVYPSGSLSSTSNSSNGSNSANNSGSSNSTNSSVASANSTKISPSSSGITTPTRVSIKEANDHLQLLHSRVSELETIIRSQSDQSAEQEEIYRRQLKELKSAKEAQIDELTKTIVRLEERLKDLEDSIKLKNEKLEENQTRLAQVDQLSDFLPNLEKFIVSLKQVTLTEENVITPNFDKELNLNLSNSSSCGLSSHQDINNNEVTNEDNDEETINSEKDSDKMADDPDGEMKLTDNQINLYSSLIDMACQTEISGVIGDLVQTDLLNGNGKKKSDTNSSDLISVSGISTIGGLCSSEPCYSKRSSIDETNSKEKLSPEEKSSTLPISGDGIDPVWNSDKQIKNSRTNRSRRVRKSASTVNYPYSASNNWERDFYCGPSLSSPGYGPGRAIGYKIHSNGSSSHLSGKIERSFSITSNFSEDEDFPSNGTRSYHK